MTDSIEQRLVRWFLTGCVGTSSRTIATVLSGNYPLTLAPGRLVDFDIPYDPSDLRRCLDLLVAIPEWESRLPEVAAIFPEWTPLVAVWDELKALYAEESPTGRCPLLYRRMLELRKSCDLYRDASAVTEGEFCVNVHAMTARHLPSDLAFRFERKGRTVTGYLDVRHGQVMPAMPVREFTRILKQAQAAFRAALKRTESAAA